MRPAATVPGRLCALHESRMAAATRVSFPLRDAYAARVTVRRSPPRHARARALLTRAGGGGRNQRGRSGPSRGAGVPPHWPAREACLDRLRSRARGGWRAATRTGFGAADGRCCWDRHKPGARPWPHASPTEHPSAGPSAGGGSDDRRPPAPWAAGPPSTAPRPLRRRSGCPRAHCLRVLQCHCLFFALCGWAGVAQAAPWLAVARRMQGRMGWPAHSAGLEPAHWQPGRAEAAPVRSWGGVDGGGQYQGSVQGSSGSRRLSAAAARVTTCGAG
jgi:hypothetical protein